MLISKVGLRTVRVNPKQGKTPLQQPVRRSCSFRGFQEAVKERLGSMLESSQADAAEILFRIKLTWRLISEEKRQRLMTT